MRTTLLNNRILLAATVLTYTLTLWNLSALVVHVRDWSGRVGDFASVIGITLALAINAATFFIIYRRQ